MAKQTVFSMDKKAEVADDMAGQAVHRLLLQRQTIWLSSQASVLSQAPCRFFAFSTIDVSEAERGQYEAVAFDPDGFGFADISECVGSCTPSLYQYELVYPDFSWPRRGPN